MIDSQVGRGIILIAQKNMKHIRSSALAIVAVISTSLTSCQNQSGGGAPITPGMEPTVLNANPSEAAQTQRLWANTLHSMSRAKQSLEANDTHAQHNLAYVFGSNDEACRQAVLKHIRLMDNKARGRKYTISLFEGGVAGFEGRMSIAAHTKSQGGAALSINKTQINGGFLAEGVIAHELSHNAAGTEDFAYIEQSQSRSSRGFNTPMVLYVSNGRNVNLDMAKRVRNADNYSLLVQQY
jgi:hypothetical protein